MIKQKKFYDSKTVLIQVTYQTICLMVMVLTLDMMVAVMKVNGLKACPTEKVQYIIKEVNITKVIFNREEDTEKVFINAKIIAMMVIGLMEKWKVKVILNGMMVELMKVILLKINSMVKVFILIKMERFLEVILDMVKNMVKVLLLFLINLFIKVIGKMMLKLELPLILVKLVIM